MFKYQNRPLLYFITQNFICKISGGPLDARAREGRGKGGCELNIPLFENLPRLCAGGQKEKGVWGK